jgi:hypothetical protein
MGIVVVDLKEAGVNYNIEVATDVAVTHHDDMYWRQYFHHQIIIERGLKVNPLLRSDHTCKTSFHSACWLLRGQHPTKTDLFIQKDAVFGHVLIPLLSR